MVADRRWRIALLLSAAIAISYLDRQTLSVAISAIQREIPVSNTQFSQLQAAFLVAYAVMYAAGGKLIDVIGTKTGFAVIMIVWSLACAAHGLATGFIGLAICRFLLGMGEGGGFPAVTKAIAEWFPTSERSTAMGMINTGSAVGAVIAPPAIALVIGLYGWRWVFFLTGALGLIWTWAWLRIYSTPAQSIVSEPSTPWLHLLRIREVWGLISAKFLSDAAWYFYLFWLPKYLYDVRGFDTKQVGTFGWIPYAAAGVGSLAGGWFSSYLIARGVGLNRSRKIAMALSVALMPWIFFMTRSPVEMALFLFSLAFCGQQAWSTMVMTIPTDLFPRNTVGSVAGLIGFGGAMGGVVFGLVVGWLLDHGSGYGPVFAIVSLMHVAAFGIVLITVPRIAPLKLAR